MILVLYREGASHLCKYTRRLEIAATQTKSAYADSKNLKPTSVGFVCIAANSIRQGRCVFTKVRCSRTEMCVHRSLFKGR